MDLNEFKNLHQRFNSFPLSRKEWESKEYRRYIEAINAHSEYENYFLKYKLKEKKIDCSKYCCLKMAYYVSMATKNLLKKDDPDIVINFYSKEKKYGLPIHDGGNSYIKIDYCPWCGKKL